MRKFHMFLTLILILGVALAAYVTFSGKTACGIGTKCAIPLKPENSLPVATNPKNEVKKQEVFEKDYTHGNIMIKQFADKIILTNKSANPLGYQVYPTELLDQIAWSPCTDFMGCPTVYKDEPLEIKLDNYQSQYKSITIFWWEQVNIPDTDSFTVGKISQQVITF